MNLKMKIMKKLFFAFTLVISFVCFGQNSFKLGTNNVLINKGIIFKYKTPLPPFQKEEDSYSSQGNTNLVSAFYARTSENLVALQIYATTIPPQFKNIDWNEMINSSINQKKFLDSFFGAANNSDTNMKISTHRVKTINGKFFLEVQSTLTVSGVTQKQVNWITIYKNTFVNILGATLLNSFDENLFFFTEFSDSVFID
jgi:hypothetical protein